MTQAAPASNSSRIPVVLDTDIGTDVDDTWALAQLLRTPKLDLKLVLTDTGDARYRASIAAKFLEVAGRTDVAVGLGKDFGPMPDDRRNQEPWIRDYDLAKFPGRLHEDGIGAFIDLVLASPVPVTVIAIGPVPTLAAALKRDARIASRCRFVGMHGSFATGYGGGPPSAEWNVRADVEALRAVLSAPWQDVLLTPLDTCGLVELGGEKYRGIWSATDDPIPRAVIENYCIFAPRVDWMKCDFFATRSTTLFDCVAVYLAHAEDLVGTERVRFRITDKGFTARDEEAGPFRARVAMRWKNLPAFEDHLVNVLLGREHR